LRWALDLLKSFQSLLRSSTRRLAILLATSGRFVRRGAAAAAQGADIVVFPELFYRGLSAGRSGAQAGISSRLPVSH
jgi:hypothetical protein